MKLFLLIISVLFLISCGSDETESNTVSSLAIDPASPRSSMELAKSSPGCTLDLGVYRRTLISVCSAGYVIDADEKIVIKEDECLQGKSLSGTDYGLGVMNAVYSPSGCTVEGRTVVRCYANNESSNLYILTGTSRPVGPFLLRKYEAECKKINGEFAVLKLND